MYIRNALFHQAVTNKSLHKLRLPISQAALMIKILSSHFHTQSIGDHRHKL